MSADGIPLQRGQLTASDRLAGAGMPSWGRPHFDGHAGGRLWRLREGLRLKSPGYHPARLPAGIRRSGSPMLWCLGININRRGRPTRHSRRSPPPGRNKGCSHSYRRGGCRSPPA